MTDKLDIIINKHIDAVSASSDPCFETATRLVAEEWVAVEVNRLLDCFAASEDQEWFFSSAPAFRWQSANLITRGGKGNDKASLLEYVGFGVGSDGE